MASNRTLTSIVSLQPLIERMRKHLRGGSVGFFNPVHPFTVQVLHPAGVQYLRGLSLSRRAALPRSLRKKGMAVLISRAVPLDEIAWKKAGIACLRCDCPGHELVYALRRSLIETGTAHTIVHGVLMVVHGMGVLLMGKSGVGKSTLALELLARGHKLVADDAVEMTRVAAGVLVGWSPPLLRGYLEARGLGVLDIRALHGRRAVLKAVRLDLIIQLASGAAKKMIAEDRLSVRRTTRRILGVAVPVLTLTALPPALGHNLATLVEAACLDQWLRLSGIAADSEFAARQLREIARQT